MERKCRREEKDGKEHETGRREEQDRMEMEERKRWRNIQEQERNTWNGREAAYIPIQTSNMTHFLSGEARTCFLNTNK